MVTNTLQLVDIVDSNGKAIPGLVPVRGTAIEKLSVDEQAAVFHAKSFDNIDYVYFRRFSDGRSSQISAYVVNNSDERLDEKALAKLQLKVWLQGAAPLLYVAWPSRIDILTCAREAYFWKNDECQYIPMGTLNTASKITAELNRFSVLHLADGTFWEQPGNGDLAEYSKTAQQMLIQAVVEADIALDGKNKPIYRQLLLLMVLIKYLEDRHVFPDDFFDGFHKGATDFFSVLKSGDSQEVCRLLDFLENRFNGDVFSLSSIERQALNNENLIHFATLVEARTLKRHATFGSNSRLNISLLKSLVTFIRDSLTVAMALSILPRY